MKRSQAGLLAPACMLLALGFAVAPLSVAAQSLEYYELTDRLDRLQREVQTLQRSVARAAAPGKRSDAATQAEIRLNEFEGVLRGLEKRIETLEIDRRRDAERLGKLASDLEVRLRMMEQPSPSSATAEAPVASGGQSGSIIGGTTAPDAPPRPLGTLTASGTAGPGKPATPKAAPKAPPVLPPGSAKEQYDYARSFILKEEFGKAEAAFAAFIDSRPKHVLSGSAYFWLGRTHFVRKDYVNASYAFADGFQKFPRGPKAPDNLYNLGVSLRQLDKKREACTAFARLLDKFPKVHRTLKTRVSRQRKRLKCG